MSNTEIMVKVTDELDSYFNADAESREDRKVGLILILYPFNEEQGQVHIGTNGAMEEDVVTIMRKMVMHYDMRQPQPEPDNDQPQQPVDGETVQ